MKQDYCHIHVILDRSGSMQSIRDDVIGGFNSFVEEQKKLPGEATITLVQFDDQDSYEVINDFAPLHEVKEFTRTTFVPRGSTPLLDAIGRGINDCESKLGRMADWDLPKKVIFCIITDGQENMSKEFNHTQIMEMIRNQRDKKWEFVFMSCDEGAIRDAVSHYGINLQNTVKFGRSSQGTRVGYSTLSHSVKTFRK
jgi:uncharacterized protein YegL